MRLVIEAVDLPGRQFAEYRNVHVGVQRGEEPWEPTPADADSVTWAVDIRLRLDKDGRRDFAGPFVKGRAGDRFVYLTWGDVDRRGHPAMFRRAKLMLDAVADYPVTEDTVLTARLGLTDEKGGPRCAAVRPPLITWTLS